ncbi:MAG: HNH endonuclease [Candidatus Latescibacterota bacterium]
MAEGEKRELIFLELVREGKYEVFENGDVYKTWCGVCKSACRNKLSKNVKKDGYCRVGFVYQGKKMEAMLHRIVYLVFRGVIPEGLHINHLDGNRQNNALSNLEAVTPRENVRHSIHVTKSRKSFGENHYKAQLKSSDVVKILYYHHYRTYTKDQLAGMFGVSKSTINDICRRKSWRWIFDKEYFMSGAGEWWKKEEKSVQSPKSKVKNWEKGEGNREDR